MERLRITYSKTAALRYTSNLDVHKIWERSLRRAKLPLAYSQGFHPQPRLNQACPLPLGVTSLCEMIDIWLEREPSVEEVSNALKPALPPGLELHSILWIDLHEPSLPTQVVSADYVATLLNPIDSDTLRSKAFKFTDETEVKIEWRGKVFDLRRLVENLEVLPPDESGRSRLGMRLAAREGATGRAEPLLAALGFDPYDVRVERVRINLKSHPN